MRSLLFRTERGWSSSSLRQTLDSYAQQRSDRNHLFPLFYNVQQDMRKDIYKLVLMRSVATLKVYSGYKKDVGNV